ncbi:MAG: hypothetical protein Q8N70_11630, partial [Deltaproteobacteria bacterium]|nr:hypothetical protein [Deltaproteobacteria bacterium]
AGVEQPADFSGINPPVAKKNDIETGRGCWAALPGSRRTMRRVFSQSLAAAPLGVGYMRF